MALVCSPQALADAASPFQFIADPKVVETYLISRVTGGSVDPQVLVSQSRCYSCLDGQQIEVQIALLCRILNGLTATTCTAQSIQTNSVGFENLPWWVDLYLLALWAGGSTDPVVLENEARCFVCIPDFYVVQTMLLCSMASTSCDPNALSALATCMSCVPNPSAARTYLLCALFNASGGDLNARITEALDFRVTETADIRRWV